MVNIEGNIRVPVEFYIVPLGAMSRECLPSGFFIGDKHIELLFIDSLTIRGR